MAVNAFLCVSKVNSMQQNKIEKVIVLTVHASI